MLLTALPRLGDGQSDQVLDLSCGDQCTLQITQYVSNGEETINIRGTRNLSVSSPPVKVARYDLSGPKNAFVEGANELKAPALQRRMVIIKVSA